jgi:hypothetical protein
MNRSFNDRMNAVNERLRYYEFKQRIQEHIRKDEPVKPEQSAQDKTSDNFLYSDHGKQNDIQD